MKNHCHFLRILILGASFLLLGGLSQAQMDGELIYDGDPIEAPMISGTSRIANSIYTNREDIGFHGVILDKIVFKVANLSDEFPGLNFTYKIYADNNGEIGELLYEKTTPDEMTLSGVLWGNYLIYDVVFYGDSFELPYSWQDDLNYYWVELNSQPEGNDAQYWVSHQFNYDEGYPSKIKEPEGNWETFVNLEGQTIKGSMEIYFSFIYIGTSEQDDIRLTYYPNPVQDYLFIDSSRKINSLSVYDIAGKMLPNKLLESDNNKLNTIGLPAGIYTAKFILENGQSGTFKFIKK